MNYCSLTFNSITVIIYTRYMYMYAFIMNTIIIIMVYAHDHNSFAICIISMVSFILLYY